MRMPRDAAIARFVLPEIVRVTRNVKSRELTWIVQVPSGRGVKNRPFPSVGVGYSPLSPTNKTSAELSDALWLSRLYTVPPTVAPATRLAVNDRDSPAATVRPPTKAESAA